MNGLEDVLVIAIIAFISGSLFGALAYRLLKGDKGKGQRVEQQMDALQEKHTHYQAEVNDHFLKTAHLINRMNEDYREINAHLAQSAINLCSEDSANELTMLNQRSRERGHLDLEGALLEEAITEENPLPDSDSNTENAEQNKENAEPPRDYAPKTDTDKGTLTEGFGLKDKKDEKESAN